MEQKERQSGGAGSPVLRESGFSYSAAVILMLLMSVLVMLVIAAVVGEDYAQSQIYLYAAYLLPQLSNLAVLALYLRRSGCGLKRMYTSCKWYYFLIALLLQFGLLFSLSSVNDLFVSLFERFGYVSQSTPLPSLEGWGLLPALITIALLPAVLEESLFRGILAREPHGAGWGTAATVLLSGALFALYHGRAEQTVYQFVCGACFALLSLRAGSILPSITGHLLNNALILVLTAFGLDEFSAPVYWTLFAVSACCLAACLIFLIFFDRKCTQKGGLAGGRQFFMSASIGMIVCAATWILNLITGFFYG